MTKKSKAARNAFDFGGPHERMPDEEVPQLRAGFENLTNKLLPVAKILIQCLELGIGE